MPLRQLMFRSSLEQHTRVFVRHQQLQHKIGMRPSANLHKLKDIELDLEAEDLYLFRLLEDYRILLNNKELLHRIY